VTETERATTPTANAPGRRRRWVRGLQVFAALVLAIVGAGFFWDARGRVATVEAGRLYRSKAMAPERLIDVCRQLGIQTVVDLRKEGEGVTEEAAALARAGIRHVNLPSTQVPDLATVDRFLDLVDETQGQRVLLHCRHGVGRSGVFSAIYRMERQGWSARWATFEALLVAGGGSFRPGSDKATFLAHYQLRRDRGAGIHAPPAASPHAILEPR
jgi:protein tyrosine phosphatase (PTP) superfamily phosphohydrolase (DUF442 family)